MPLGLFGTVFTGTVVALAAVVIGAPELLWRTVFDLALNPKAQNPGAVRLFGYDSGADAPTTFGHEGDHPFCQGKQVLVVGGTKGIGRGIAIALAARGAAVDIIGRDKRAGAEMLGLLAAKNSQATHRFFAADLSTATGCREAVANIAAARADLASKGEDQTIRSASYAGLALTVGVWPSVSKPLTDDGVELPLFLDVTARFLVIEHMLRAEMLLEDCVVMSVLASGQREPPGFIGKLLRYDIEAAKAKIAAPPAGGWSAEKFADVEAAARADARVFIRALAPAVVAHDAMLLALASQHQQLVFVGTFPGIVESDVTVPTLGKTLAAVVSAAAKAVGVSQTPELCGERHARILHHVAAVRAAGGLRETRPLLFDHLMVPREMGKLSLEPGFSEWMLDALTAWVERSTTAPA